MTTTTDTLPLVAGTPVTYHGSVDEFHGLTGVVDGPCPFRPDARYAVSVGGQVLILVRPQSITPLDAPDPAKQACRVFETASAGYTSPLAATL